MKKVTCENGHFYDADRFELCPICGQGSSGTLPDPAAVFESEDTVPLPPSSAIDELAATAWIPPEEMHQLWGDDAPIEPMAVEFTEQQKIIEADVPKRVDGLAPTQTDVPALEKIGKSIPAQVDELVPTQEDVTEKTDESISTQIEESAPVQVDELAPTQMGEPEPEESKKACSTRVEILAPAQADELTPAQTEQPEPEGEAPIKEPMPLLHRADAGTKESIQGEQLTLAQAVAQADATSIPAVPPEPPRQKEEASVPRPATLPVGWLVGLSGANRGRLFPCKLGRNRIGRAPQMDIVISAEPSVDLDTHAQIIYEPKKRQFFLQVGNGDGLSYRNDELVFTHEELHAYDRITLGDAEFIFLPLCGEAFDWNMNTRGE